MLNLCNKQIVRDMQTQTQTQTHTIVIFINQIIADMQTQTPIFCFLILNVMVMPLPYYFPIKKAKQTFAPHSTDNKLN